MSPLVDADYVERTLSDLVRINSINPSLVEGGAGEAEIAAYLVEAFEALGLETATHEPVSGRVSVVGRLVGTGGGRSLMLNAHTDTVGVEGMEDPFRGEVQDGRLYGRGAQDMKGGLAAMMGAVKALCDAGYRPEGDVLLAAAADEEHASLGTTDLIERYTVDGAIVTEPTDLGLCVAHKGFIWLSVETHGRAAHGSRPDEGIDANLRMGRVLAALEELEQDLRMRPPHPLVGSPSLHAAMLEGGTALSQYAAKCTLHVERRTIPGETEGQVLSEFQTLLDPLADADSTFRASLKSNFVRGPFEVSAEAPLVQTLATAAQAVLGRRASPVGQTYWTDAALLADAGIETVVMGPVGAGLHTDEEWVDLESVNHLSSILAHTILSYCSRS